MDIRANGESKSSKARRQLDEKKHGRKSDFCVLFNDDEIVFGEIKPPDTPEYLVKKDLIKLAEFLKGSLDFLYTKYKNIIDLETFGILVYGKLLLS